jgi:hypothetical protein
MQPQSWSPKASVFGGKNSNDSSGGAGPDSGAGRPATRGLVSQRSSVVGVSRAAMGVWWLMPSLGAIRWLAQSEGSRCR